MFTNVYVGQMGVARCYKDESVCLELKSLILYPYRRKYHMSTYIVVGVQFKQLRSCTLSMRSENFALITDTHYFEDGIQEKEHRDHWVSSGVLHG